jgi:heme-degrading monooxygenase HmoA
MSTIILRRWTGKLRTADEAEYLDYVMRTGGGDYARTEGNLGHQIVMRTLGDGTSEIATLSWWRDMDAVRGFAGEQPEIAVYYPEDDRYLIERPRYVEHFRVLDSDIPLGKKTPPNGS